jgi:hypothetical protein
MRSAAGGQIGTDVALAQLGQGLPPSKSRHPQRSRLACGTLGNPFRSANPRPAGSRPSQPSEPKGGRKRDCGSPEQDLVTLLLVHRRVADAL